MRILIIKTSAIGDILQSFVVVEFIKRHFPRAQIHWAVLEQNAEAVLAHRLIDQVLVFARKKLFSFLFSLRKKPSFDVVFDLQGNLRSALIAWFAKSRQKVGFSWKFIPEKVALLSANRHYAVDTEKNIRQQYLALVQNYFSLFEPIGIFPESSLKLTDLEEQKLAKLEKQHLEKIRILVAPFARWPSKCLEPLLLTGFLKKIQEKYDPFFFFLQSSEKEKKQSLALARSFNGSALVLEKLSLPLLQHFMGRMDLVVAMDSGPLHLALATRTPSVGFFGPSRSSIFGGKDNLLSFEGSCPLFNFKLYPQLLYKKRCPLLRSCQGRCIDAHHVEDFFRGFEAFWQKVCPLNLDSANKKPADLKN
ncbi:MAG: glycosyltransferase family 9 protein [Parachlamydiales bacterium]|jgi:heptosyltransferase-1